jgi:hypothetical protein
MHAQSSGTFVFFTDLCGRNRNGKKWLKLNAAYLRKLGRCRGPVVPGVVLRMHAQSSGMELFLTGVRGR